MDTIYKSPDWLYKPANINVLPEMQSELLAYITEKTGGDWDNLTHVFYVYYDSKELLDACPITKQQLSKLGLAEIYAAVTFTIYNPNLDRTFPIHIDYPNQARLSLALTIPLLNCENSYTAWYDAPILNHEALDDSYVMHPLVATTVVCDESQAVEIGRVTSTVPHWINVGKLHKGVSENKKTRVLCTLRFTPRIFEMIADGYFDEKLVKH